MLPILPNSYLVVPWTFFYHKMQCRTYFMFHGMDVSDPATLFKYLPILSFTEGYIYQVEFIEINYHLDMNEIKHCTSFWFSARCYEWKDSEFVSKWWFNFHGGICLKAWFNFLTFSTVITEKCYLTDIMLSNVK